jgi:hypothetical protein
MPAETPKSPTDSSKLFPSSPNLDDFGPRNSNADPYLTPEVGSTLGSEVDLTMAERKKPKQQPSIASTKESAANSADKGDYQSIGTGGGDETSTASTAD